MLRSDAEISPLLASDDALLAAEGGASGFDLTSTQVDDLKACVAILKRARRNNLARVRYAPSAACISILLSVVVLDALLIKLYLMSAGYVADGYHRHPLNMSTIPGENVTTCGAAFALHPALVCGGQYAAKCPERIDVSDACLKDDFCISLLHQCCQYLDAVCRNREYGFMSAITLLGGVTLFIGLAALGVMVRIRDKADFYDLQRDDKHLLSQTSRAVSITNIDKKSINKLLVEFRGALAKSGNMEMFRHLSKTDATSYAYMLKHGFYAHDASGNDIRIMGAGNDVTNMIESYVRYKPV